MVDTMEKLRIGSHISGSTAAYVESLYESYLEDPGSISDHWREYFDALPSQASGDTLSHAAVRNFFVEQAKKPPMRIAAGATSGVQDNPKQWAVYSLIDAYRRFGHLNAALDPLGLKAMRAVSMLDLGYYGFSEDDFSAQFDSNGLLASKASLQVIYDKLRQIYCGTAGLEYMHISEPKEVQWLRERIEAREASDVALSDDERQHILEKLVAAEGMEQFLARRYVGQKRFSLEGGETFIPVVSQMIQSAGAHSAQEILIGMAHRGRLNVLLNILGMSAKELFNEFEGKVDFQTYSGDVKYHKGFSSDIKTPGGAVHLALGFNPSHLEAINAVLMGSARARQHRHRNDRDASQVMPIIVHGDAAFTGQGVVMETLNMAQTRAYNVQGSVHIVINNQVGFTTSDPNDARSSHYCTDVAKMIEMPIFHVNADDPETAVFFAKLAVEYRMTFKKDVLLDLVCYRRLGHNEADEPAATQPLMYQNIRSRSTTCELYAQQQIEKQRITEADFKKLKSDYEAALESGRRVVETLEGGVSEEHMANWHHYLGQEWRAPFDVNLGAESLKELAPKIFQVPEGFTLQRQVQRMMDTRLQMVAGEQSFDWGTAEVLAYASLIDQGFSVRLVGQDCRRGTFAHRHVALHDQETGETYMLLSGLNSKSKADMQVYDSVLSEEAAVGFEYGYSTTEARSLVIWEAQFGDFANGAQVLIDQFISSGWQKWQRLSGLVMLLPHGCEGMGPEHSSARLERYLQLCAQKNIQVCSPTTPAQIFHLLRRQMLRPYRRPLIVMTPKGLLRHKAAVSTWDDLIDGQFHVAIPEIEKLTAKDVKRVILCTGKLYYELLEKRTALKRKDIAIMRIEQLYPFPYDEVIELLRAYDKTTEIVWCQEEPRNQGAWYQIRHCLEACLEAGQTLRYIGRDTFAAPAPGYHALHKQQQDKLINDAFA